MSQTSRPGLSALPVGALLGVFFFFFFAAIAMKGSLRRGGRIHFFHRHTFT